MNNLFCSRNKINANIRRRKCEISLTGALKENGGILLVLWICEQRHLAVAISSTMLKLLTWLIGSCWNIIMNIMCIIYGVDLLNLFGRSFPGGHHQNNWVQSKYIMCKLKPDMRICCVQHNNYWVTLDSIRNSCDVLRKRSPDSSVCLRKR